METPERIATKDLQHGRFYRDLYEEVFCFFDTEEGRFLEYTGNGYSVRPRKLRIDAVPVLSHGVSEVDIRDYSEGLKEEIEHIKSLEQLARESQPTKNLNN